jgi:hypothetical protein
VTKRVDGGSGLSMAVVPGGSFFFFLIGSALGWDATICFLFFWSAARLDVELVVACYFLSAEVLVATLMPMGEQWEC